MNTQLRTQAKVPSTPKPSLAPVQTQLLQRKCACGGSPGIDGECVECREKRLSLQRRATNPAVEVPPIVYDVLSSPGQPLDARTREFMEPRFGHDFSQVRVHTDVLAAESTRVVKALAYTVGRDVVSGAGQYAPATSGGRRLLAHELTHVVQQSIGSSSFLSGEAPLHNSRASSSVILSREATVIQRAGHEETRDPTTGGEGPPVLPAAGAAVPVPPAAGAGTAAPTLPTVTIAEVNAPNTPPPIKRIPPRVDTQVRVIVAQPSGVSLSPITLSIGGSGRGNGEVSINGSHTDSLTASKTVMLKGTQQTSPGHAGQLKLVARLGNSGQILAESNGFSVAAYPTKINFSYDGNNAGGQQLGIRGYPAWGPRYRLTFESDSKVRGDCDLIKLKEDLFLSQRTGFFETQPLTQTGFLSTSESVSRPDQHTIVYRGEDVDFARFQASANRGGIMLIQQLFRFACQRTNILEDPLNGPTVRASGFEIRFILRMGPKPHLRVQKLGLAHHGVEAGWVNDQSVKDIPIE